jgi:hypothetical protein
MGGDSASMGSFVGGVIGSYWGYPGSMIGSMLGAWLFGMFSGKKHKPYNETTRNINLSTKLDTLPYLIGTDMCPGQIVWFGQLGLYDSATLRATEVYDSGSSYFSSYYRPLDTKFAVAFCENMSATNTGQHRIDRLFFGGKDIWNFGLWLSEAIKWEAIVDARDLGAGVTPIKINKRTWLGSNDYLLEIPNPDVPHSFYTWFSYDGWFGDFTIAENLGTGVTTDNAINFRQSIALTQFPDITGEVSSQYCQYSGEAFANGLDFFSGILGGMHSVTRHCIRDGLHEYFYTVYYGYSSDPGGLQQQFQLYRVHPIFGKTLIANNPVYGSYTDMLSLTLGWNCSMQLSRNDEWDNRLYFFFGRIIPEQVHWLAQYWQYKHHAPYSLKYDIFYIDKDDTLNPVSLKLDETIVGLNHFEDGNCAFVARSMEITSGGKILVFGHMAQDSFPIYDQLRVTQDTAEPGTRIYMDLSGYPDNFWLNQYIWENISNLSIGGVGVPRKIAAQTSTYVDIVPTGMGRNPAQGAYMTLCYAKRYDQEWFQVDVGSTTTTLITNLPPHSTMKINNNGKFESVAIIGDNYNRAFTIDYANTSVGNNIHLLEPLPTTPVPGQRYYLVPEHLSGDDSTIIEYDPDVVNPQIPYSHYANEHNDNDPWHFDDVDLESNGFGSDVVLQFDKNTGDFEGQIHTTIATHFWNNPWGLSYAHGDDAIVTSATEEEIAVYYTCMQVSSCGKTCQWIIDSATLAFTHVGYDGSDGWNEDGLWESNPYSCAHAWGAVRVATAWLWEKDPDTGNYFKQWYSLNYDYPNGCIYFLKLLNNRFSNEQGIPLLRRPFMYTGPLYNGWWHTGTTFTEGMHIAKCGIENKLYIYLNHSYDGGNYSFGGYPECWVFDSPTVENPSGSLRCISSGGEPWLSWASNNNTLGGINNWDWTSTFTTVFNETSQAFNSCSYHCDEHPLEAIVRITQHNSLSAAGTYAYGYIRFPTDYYYFQNPVFAICSEPVSVEASVGNSLVTFQEQRHRYSLCLSGTQTVGDIVKDIMQSCMGWAFPCGRTLKLVVPTATETPKFAFGKEDNDHQFTQQINIPPQSGTYISTSPTTSLRLDLDLSIYPINYFLGETGFFTYQQIVYDFVVIEHSSNSYIKISAFNEGDYFSGFKGMVYNGYWNGLNIQGTQINIYKKDNIKEGSFTFAQKSRVKRPNVVRVEHTSRLNAYVTEVSESQSDYLRQFDGYDKIQTYKMPGVKRTSQANRLSQQLMDYVEFVEWSCAFETDVCGLYLCPGDIVAVTHDVPGWFGKWFRIMSIEESGEDFNAKLELEEYNPHVYHDRGGTLLVNNAYGGFTPSSSDWTQHPLPVNGNISVLESVEYPRLYFGFSTNTAQTNIIGGRVFRLNGSTYEPVGNIVVPVTMTLVNSLTDSILDNSYIEYSNLSGALSESGIVWIGSELIRYNGVDTTNHRLMNLVRGYDDTVIASHAPGDVITVFDDLMYIEIQSSWVGSNTFKIVPLVYNNAPVGDVATATSVTVIISGYGLKPYFPESLRLTEE